MSIYRCPRPFWSTIDRGSGVAEVRSVVVRTVVRSLKELHLEIFTPHSRNVCVSHDERYRLYNIRYGHQLIVRVGY
jgi:hypothetical protein